MADELDGYHLKPKIGSLYRGQAWVELHGTFDASQLRELADQIDKNCEGLRPPNAHQGRHKH